MNDERVVLLVEFTSGEVVAVPFVSRDAADRWEQSHDYEVIGRPSIATAGSLSVGARKRAES